MVGAVDLMQMGRWARWGAVLVAGAAAGCSMTGSGDSPGMTVASLGANPAPAAVPQAAPVSMGPLLEGPIGARLAEADRDQAFKAETQALESGERRTWRGSKGTYGFVVPGASASAEAGEECRSFTHTIYFGGRPQSGQGTGCRTADGSWRIAG